MAVVEDKAGFDELLDALPDSGAVVVDEETSGLDMFGLADRYEVPLGKPGGPKGELVDPEIGPARITGTAIGVPFGKGIKTFYLPFRHEDKKELRLPFSYRKKLTQAVEKRGLLIVNHNIKFDLKMQYVDGVMPDLRKVKIGDTMLLCHMLDERHEHYTLENMVDTYTDYSMKYKAMPKAYLKDHKLRRYSQIPVEVLAPYAEDDVRATWKLWQAMYPKLVVPDAPWYGGPDLEAAFWDEMDVTEAITWMEIRGFKIDIHKTRAIVADLTTQLAEAVRQIREVVGDPDFNPGSFPQLSRFWESKGWPVAIDPLKGSVTFQDMHLLKLFPKTGDDKRMPHPDYPGMYEFVMLLLRGRTLSKFKGTYLESYLRLADERGFLHPSFHQHGTVTGRLSSSSPNVQNIPKTVATGRTALQKDAEEIIPSPVRDIIVPRSLDHRLVEIDYSQQEIRLFLHYVDEPKMRQIVLEGGDVHHFAASQMFNGMPDKHKDPVEYKRRRHMAKFINFGIIYGMGRPKLADMFDLTIPEAGEYYQKYLGSFPHIKEFIEEVRGVADLRQYVKNCFGRRRRMRLLTSEEKRLGKVKTGNMGYTQSVRPTDTTADAHKALNSIIQGGAADMVKRAMARIHRLLDGTNSYLVNQIHDALVFEIHVDEMDELLPKIKDAMTNWPNLKTPFHVPFTVDVSVAKWEWSTSEASEA